MQSRLEAVPISNNIQFNIYFFTNFNDTWEISLQADKKKETKGYKKTLTLPLVCTANIEVENESKN